jgi:hypothetical protein
MKSTVAASVLPLLAQLFSPVVAAESLNPQLSTTKLKKQQFGIKNIDLDDSRKAAVDDDDIVIMGKGSFDQLIDHDHPEKGTFKQRYWWNAEYYEEE